MAQEPFRPIQQALQLFMMLRSLDMQERQAALQEAASHRQERLARAQIDARMEALALEREKIAVEREKMDAQLAMARERMAAAQAAKEEAAAEKAPEKEREEAKIARESILGVGQMYARPMQEALAAAGYQFDESGAITARPEKETQTGKMMVNQYEQFRKWVGQVEASRTEAQLAGVLARMQRSMPAEDLGEGLGKIGERFGTITKYMTPQREEEVGEALKREEQEAAVRRLSVVFPLLGLGGAFGGLKRAVGLGEPEAKPTPEELLQ